ncbi:hypothetical protein [Nocardia sp. bgisy134]|uniref:hypothetical protein n=1 Tax=Nocardia sp. bgisy134 TaxID=3413789 RepID=UPI003D7263AE
MFDPVVSDLARDVVGEVVPAELPVFDAVSRAYFKSPKATLHGRSKAGPLGFGLAETATMLTPAVLFAATTLLNAFIDPLARRTSNALVRKVFGVFQRRRVHSREEISRAFRALTPAQESTLRQLAVTSAQEAHADPEMSERIADLLIANLRGVGADENRHEQ